MRYFIRSVKYFLHLSVLLAVILFVLVQLNLAEGNLATMFRNGYDSIWQIALLLAAFSAIYPRIGYSTRRTDPIHAEIKDSDLQDIMNILDYKLESKDGENLYFVSRRPLFRLIRTFEDRITLTRALSCIQVEGPSKDIVRILSAIENRYRSSDEL